MNEHSIGSQVFCLVVSVVGSMAVLIAVLIIIGS